MNPVVFIQVANCHFVSIIFCFLLNLSTYWTIMIALRTLKQLVGSQHIKAAVKQKKILQVTLPRFSSIRNAVTSQKLSMKEREANEFALVLPTLLSDLMGDKAVIAVPEMPERLYRVFQHHLSEGDYFRGLTTVRAFKMLADNPSVEDLYLSQIAGWATEMFNGFVISTYDLVDNAVTRRGKLCWYRASHLATKAINDNFMMEGGMYQILMKYFHSKPYYLDFIELCHKAGVRMFVGQRLDFFCLDEHNHPLLDKFTMKYYTTTIESKTAYCTCYFPIAVALHMAGFSSPEYQQKAKEILLQMGTLFQIQNDYIAFFGDSNDKSKVDLDIPEGLCTWPVVKALELATPEQRRIIEENYGFDKLDRKETLKELYKDMNLPSIYLQHREENIQDLYNKIHQLPSDLNPNVFTDMMHELSLT